MMDDNIIDDKSEGPKLIDTDLMLSKLRGANLILSNIINANLISANLRGVNLRGVNLKGADLRGADLRDADLKGVILKGATLRGADLRGADLRGANLIDADLRGVNLRGADLSDADLKGADLRDTDLRGTKGNLIEYRLGKITTEPIIGYKACKNDVIVTLEIPKGAVIFSINGDKCRTNKAKVVAIDGADRAFSFFNDTSYYVGDEFTIHNFNLIYNVECAEGIHFFMTREALETFMHIC